MIDRITRDDALELARATPDHWVSLYLATNPQGDVAAGRLTLEHLIAEAQRELLALGVDAKDVDARLAPARSVLGDNELWVNAGHGLAVFLGPDTSRVFRLGTAPREMALVSSRPHLTPLVGELTEGDEFHVLAISKKQVSLFRGDRIGLEPVAFDGPTSMDEALAFDDRERSLQSHSAGRTSAGVTAAFHGQGAGRDTADADRDRFLRLIDGAVAAAIGRDPAPVVLAGVTELTAAFKRVTALREVVDATISGNPDRTPQRELRERAWPILAERRIERIRGVVERALANADRGATDLDTVGQQARQGLVAAVVLGLDDHEWGDPANDEHHDDRQIGDDDLLADALIETRVHGGETLVAPPETLPDGLRIAAVFRS